MTLTTEEGQLYYKLWLPLLDYVNKKYSINSSIRQMVGAASLNPKEVKEVADKLWDDVSVIDAYLAECADDISEEHIGIVESWKKVIRGKFLLERHLKKGSIFISMDDEKVYQVSGIISSWEEMFWHVPTPIMMEAAFMPFKDVIISDGLVIPYSIMIGGNMAGQFKDIYLTAKKNGRLHRTL